MRIITLLSLALTVSLAGCRTSPQPEVRLSDTAVPETVSTEKEPDAPTYTISEVRRASQGIMEALLREQDDLVISDFRVIADGKDTGGPMFPSSLPVDQVSAYVRVSGRNFMLEVFLQPAGETETEKVLGVSGSCQNGLSIVSSYSYEAAKLIVSRDKSDDEL